MIACPIVTPHIQEVVQRLRNKFQGKMRHGIFIPSFDHVTFGQPFTATYYEASRINLGIEVAALRLSMEDHLFILGEAKFFEGKVVDTLYIEVITDNAVLVFLRRMRAALFGAKEVTILGPRLDDGEPKLHITLFQGKNIAKKSKRLLRDVREHNRKLQATRKESFDHLIVFETFIPALYAKYSLSGWKLLGPDPRQAP